MAYARYCFPLFAYVGSSTDRSQVMSRVFLSMDRLFPGRNQSISILTWDSDLEPGYGYISRRSSAMSFYSVFAAK